MIIKIKTKNTLIKNVTEFIIYFTIINIYYILSYYIAFIFLFINWGMIPANIIILFIVTVVPIIFITHFLIKNIINKSKIKSILCAFFIIYELLIPFYGFYKKDRPIKESFNKFIYNHYEKAFEKNEHKTQL